MIISPIPRGLTEQLKMIPLSLIFLGSKEYADRINLRASLLVVYSATAYLLVSSNLNINVLPFFLRALVVSTLSLFPAAVVCILWVVRYHVELDFLHNVSQIIILSTTLLLLPPFPGTTNIVDSVMVIQYIIFIYSVLTVLDNILLSRLFGTNGWNLSLQVSASYYWAALSSARCCLQSVYLSLCSLYFIKFRNVSTKSQNVRLRRFLAHKKAHTSPTGRLTISLARVDVGRQTRSFDLLYTALILVIYGRIWYTTVWKGSAITKYLLQYCGIGDLISLYFNRTLSHRIASFDNLTQYVLYLIVFFIVGWLYYYIYQTRIHTLKLQQVSRDLAQAFCRKGFHLLYIVVLLFLFSDPVVFFVLSSIAVGCFCILEAVRGQVQTPFHTYTQCFVVDKRSNVELSHIFLLLNGSVFPAVYFLLWLAAGPPMHTPDFHSDARHSSNSWSKTLRFIRSRDTKLQSYDSFLSAGIVTTICADACAVYASIIFTYITGFPPRRYKDIFYIKFKSNLIVIPDLSEKGDSIAKRLLPKRCYLSSHYRSNIPVTLLSTETTCTGLSLFSRGCHNTCLNKNRTFVGSVGFWISSTLICTLLYGYSISQSLILSMITALAEAVSSIDNLLLPFIFICFRGLAY
ncbi:Hypothetical protein GLP15_1810 [Giardia lamblia P15]|uniref:dolichol kinase n=1 Tax=Giardia intestinalis (strain P15) TaxID=658858 RepID=E1EW64_GIAIA|nr:Hypothetical protein GLP15_1810 [Giardia lamblia P15]